MNKVNVESKSNLAKLLAGENISVVHDSMAETAFIDLKDRVITLPILKEMNGSLYDVFIAHEVSHALHTPYDTLMKFRETKPEIPFPLINIAEDVRIDKLIQEKYKGLKRDYKVFRIDVLKRDFFKLNERNLEEFNLADKINIYTKLREKSPKFPWNSEESEILKFTDSTETFEDVLMAAEKIYEYMKNNNQEMKSVSDMTSGGFKTTDGNVVDSETGKPRIQALEDFENGEGLLDNLIDKKNFESDEKIFAEIAFPNSDGIHANFQDAFKIGSFVDTKRNALEFIKKANPVISNMVNIFNLRKNAMEQRRTLYSKTGRIDRKNLAHYKFKDNIFLTSETHPKAKSHGFIIFVDFSESMREIMTDTIKQLYILIAFCKRLDIPFQVYAFSTDFGCKSYIESNGNKLIPGEPNPLCKLMDSRENLATIKDKVTDLLTQEKKFGSTPLCSTVFHSEIPIREFIQQNKTQKNSLIFLSDGYETDDFYIKLSENSWIFDRETGKNYKYNGRYPWQSYLEYLKYKYSLNKVITIFLDDGYSNSSLNVSAKRLMGNFKKSLAKDVYTSYDDGIGIDKLFIVDPKKMKVNLNYKKSFVFLNTLIEFIS